MLDIKDISGLKVGFIGSMNAMPMALALKLKELGFNYDFSKSRNSFHLATL